MKNLILKVVSLFKRTKKTYQKNSQSTICNYNINLSWEVNGKELPVLKGDKSSYFVWARSEKTGNMYKKYITKQIIKKLNENN